MKTLLKLIDCGACLILGTFLGVFLFLAFVLVFG